MMVWIKISSICCENNYTTLLLSNNSMVILKACMTALHFIWLRNHILFGVLAQTNKTQLKRGRLFQTGDAWTVTSRTRGRAPPSPPSSWRPWRWRTTTVRSPRGTYGNSWARTQDWTCGSCRSGSRTGQSSEETT